MIDETEDGVPTKADYRIMVLSCLMAVVYFAACTLGVWMLWRLFQWARGLT